LIAVLVAVESTTARSGGPEFAKGHIQPVAKRRLPDKTGFVAVRRANPKMTKSL
jgi:hypothetical protein